MKDLENMAKIWGDVSKVINKLDVDRILLPSCGSKSYAEKLKSSFEDNQLNASYSLTFSVTINENSQTSYQPMLKKRKKGGNRYGYC